MSENHPAIAPLTSRLARSDDDILLDVHRSMRRSTYAHDQRSIRETSVRKHRYFRQWR